MKDGKPLAFLFLISSSRFPKNISKSLALCLLVLRWLWLLGTNCSTFASKGTLYLLKSASSLFSSDFFGADVMVGIVVC